MLPTSQTIALREITTDRYGRTVAEAYRIGESVGLQLVSEGYAIVYRRYLDGCADTEAEYLAADEQAKALAVKLLEPGYASVAVGFQEGAVARTNYQLNMAVI